MFNISKFSINYIYPSNLSNISWIVPSPSKALKKQRLILNCSEEVKIIVGVSMMIKVVVERMKDVQMYM